MRFRTPLNQVRGLGSAKDGTHHWWLQRLTALALIPLGIWLIASILTLVGADYATANAWLGSPLYITLAIATIVALFFHAQLGMQVVIEDYVHNEGLRLLALVVVKLGSAMLGLTCVVAVLIIALKG